MNNTFEQLLNTGQTNATGPGSALASSTSLTDISAGGNTAGQALALNASALQPGMILRTTVTGIYSTAGSAPNLTVGLYYGGVAGTALAAMVAETMVVSISNSFWELSLLSRVESTGTSGTVRTIGSGFFGGSGAAGVPNTTSSSGNLVTIDTSAAKILTIGAQWSASSASNSIQCMMFTVELLNQGIS